ncbi:MAG TPA: hypothetical protein VIK53_14620 [Verrucomicrobiae bacterium]
MNRAQPRGAERQVILTADAFSGTVESFSRTVVFANHAADSFNCMAEFPSRTVDRSSRTVRSFILTAGLFSQMAGSINLTAGGFDRMAGRSSRTNKSFNRTVFRQKHAKNGKNRAFFLTRPPDTLSHPMEGWGEGGGHARFILADRKSACKVMSSRRQRLEK